MLAFSLSLLAGLSAAQGPCFVRIGGECTNMTVGQTQVLNALARPQGGAFHWDATLGSGVISPSTADDPTFEFTAVSPGLVVLTLTYTSSLGCVASTTCGFRVYVDSDGDGIGDPLDDCPFLYDPEQLDSDGDGVPDVCEPQCAAYSPDLTGMPGETVVDHLLIENTGLENARLHWEVYQSGGLAHVALGPTSGSVRLDPGAVADVPIDVLILYDTPLDVAELTIVVKSDSGKVLALITELVSVLLIPPPPPPCTASIVPHKPRVIAAAEPALLDNQKMDPGAITFVNLDNDNDNHQPDLNDNEVAGENEMVRTTLRIKPASLAAGNLRLAPTKGGAQIKIRKTATKGTAYNFGDPIPLNTLVKSADNQWLQVDVWVEGIAPHTEKQGTVLELTYDQDASCKDRAALTVVGVKQLNWLGKGNGFTVGSDAFDSDVLDTNDKNFPAGALKSHAVFPDARAPNFNVPRDKVKLEVELTVPVPEALDVFVRVFDVDDPSVETAQIDPNDLGTAGPYDGTAGGNAVSGGTLRFTVDEDNRGLVDGKRFGKLDGQDANGIARIAFAKDESKKSIEFRVSLFAGDDYRAAANGDRAFLAKLRNRDQNDGLEIVDPMTGAGNPPAPVALPFSSHVLTVWRMLHVERDSMKALTAAQNRATGSIERIDNTIPALFLTNTGVLLNGTLAADLNDGSSTPPGRFQSLKNGPVYVGTSRITSLAQLDTNFIIASNDALRFVMDAAVELPCALNKGAASAVTKVKQLAIDAGSGNSVVTVGDDLKADQFKDGTITIGLQTFDVASNGVTQVNLKVKATLSFTAVDDDTAVLPQAAFVDVSLMKLNAADTYVYPGAYIWPVFDGGGSGGGVETADVPSTPNLPLVDNVAGELTILPFFRQGSAANESDPFWVVYALSAFQHATTADNDPYPDEAAEPDFFGYGGYAPGSELSNTVVSRGGDGCTVYLETIADRLGKLVDPLKAQPGLEARVVPHEIGHEFGLAHNTGVMTSSVQSSPLGAAYVFSNKDKNLLRCRKTSPGRPLPAGPPAGAPSASK